MSNFEASCNDCVFYDRFNELCTAADGELDSLLEDCPPEYLPPCIRPCEVPHD